MIIPCRRVQSRLLVIYALLLLTFCSLLAGCGREREEEFLYAADSPPVTVNYVAPDFAIFKAPEEVAIERFKERAPSIEIDRQPFQRSGSDYLFDNPPPDVMLLWDGELLRGAAEQGLLSDLSDIWTENNFAERYGEQFRNISRFDGTLRFVPAGFSWTGIYYNKELFERYGLTPRGRSLSVFATRCWPTARRRCRWPGRTHLSAAFGSTI